MLYNNYQLIFTRWYQILELSGSSSELCAISILDYPQIFNNEVDAYKGWTLFLIFLSIVVLIAGVVLLTHKKPEPMNGKVKSATLPRVRRAKNKSPRPTGDLESHEENENGDERDNERDVLWEVGNASDDDDQGEDEDIDHHQHPSHSQTGVDGRPKKRTPANNGEESVGLIPTDDDDNVHDKSRHSVNSFRDVLESYGSWQNAGTSR